MTPYGRRGEDGRLVLDTNVVVSGLLWRGPPRQVIEAGRRGPVAERHLCAVGKEPAGSSPLEGACNAGWRRHDRPKAVGKCRKAARASAVDGSSQLAGAPRRSVAGAAAPPAGACTGGTVVLPLRYSAAARVLTAVVVTPSRLGCGGTLVLHGAVARTAVGQQPPPDAAVIHLPVPAASRANAVGRPRPPGLALDLH